MKIHSSCEIEYFVQTHLCKLCVYTRPIFHFVSDRFSKYFPDRFFRTYGRQISRPVADLFHGLVQTSIRRLASHVVSQMTFRLPVPLPSRREQRNHFPIPSLGKTQNEFRLRRANRVTSRTDRCPSLPRVPLVSCFLCLFVVSVLQTELTFYNFCGPQRETCTMTICRQTLPVLISSKTNDIIHMNGYVERRPGHDTTLMLFAR